MQGCSELIWDLWMKSSELLPSIVILWKLKAHHVWVSSLFPRRGHSADQDWCKKGNQCRKNRKMKSALAEASIRILHSLLGCWMRNLFLSGLEKKRYTKQKGKNLLLWGSTILLLSLEWEMFTLMTLPLNGFLCHLGVTPGGLYPNVSFGGS